MKNQLKPIRVNKKQAALLLGISVSSLDMTMKNDPTFPRCVKTSKARQAHAYFIYAELEAWAMQTHQQAEVA